MNMDRNTVSRSHASGSAPSRIHGDTALSFGGRQAGLRLTDHAKALAHRGEAPRLGDSELDSLVEDFGLVADGDVSLAASPRVEG